MLSFRASSFGDYESCPRRFGARFLLASGMANDFGFHARPLQNNIGAVIGTAVHSGVAHLMRELKRTGEHGGYGRTQAAQSVAGCEVADMTQEPVHLDSTTKTTTAAIATAQGMVARYHIDARPSSEPVIIESGMAAIFPHPDLMEEGYRVTGTMDLYMVERELWDFYTGRNPPNKVAQSGNYSLILRSNEHEVDRISIKHALRVGGTNTQPPIATVDIPQVIAERHALAVSRRAAHDVNEMLRTGDAEVLMANPSDRLCGKKYCPAHGTSFCRIGALVNPPKNG